MLRPYVLNAHSVPFDIDRARFLADDDFWNDAVDRCKAGGSVEAQAVWERYCAAHKKRHGEPFGPQVMPDPL